MNLRPFLVLCTTVIAVLAPAGCRRSEPDENSANPPAPAAGVWFEETAAKAGLKFTHAPGPEAEKFFMPASMGSGVALFDYDNDGRLDIYLVQNGGPDSKSTNRLYHQRADGTF